MERVVLALEADSHAGNIVGLLAPGTTIIGPDDVDDVFEVALNDYQQDLWERRLRWIEEARKFAGDDPLIHVHDGDITDGKKYPNMKLTTSIAGQAEIARANMMPWHTRGKVMKSMIIAGTGSHAFEDASAEILITELMKAAGYPVQLVLHALLDVDGGEVDVAHHGPSKGIRKWLEGNILRYYLKSAMMSEMMEGNKPPELYVRAHFHDYQKEVVPVNEYESTIVLLPCLCGMGEYGRQVTRSKPVLTNGIVLAEFIDGRLVHIEKMLNRIDLRTKVKVRI